MTDGEQAETAIVNASNATHRRLPRWRADDERAHGERGAITGGMRLTRRMVARVPGGRTPPMVPASSERGPDCPFLIA